MAQYQPGQRWISDSEAELGLGTILTEEGRLLTVLYPATGETRQYATRNAPLTRVRFAPGDEITHFEGWKLTVQEVEDIDGLLVYHGLNGCRIAVIAGETGVNWTSMPSSASRERAVRKVPSRLSATALAALSPAWQNPAIRSSEC